MTSQGGLPELPLPERIAQQSGTHAACVMPLADAANAAMIESAVGRNSPVLKSGTRFRAAGARRCNYLFRNRFRQRRPIGRDTAAHSGVGFPRTKSALQTLAVLSLDY
jgi:hypothetical protein